MSASPGFKLDIGCVERDEDRADFLSACSRLDLRAIRDLVETKGVDVNAVDSVGQNCVHFIVGSVERDRQDRQAQLLGYLSSLGADVNARRDTDGWTPIFIAVIFKRAHLVQALLANGADAQVKDQQEMTPEDWADKYRLGDIKDLLLHSRSKVPHSRFSCVQQGPALKPSNSSSLESPDDEDEEEDEEQEEEKPRADVEGGDGATQDPETPSSASGSASSEAPVAVAVAVAAAASIENKEGSTETCLLAAQ